MKIINMENTPVIKKRKSKYNTDKLYFLTPFEDKTIVDLKIAIEKILVELQITKKKFAQSLGMGLNRFCNLMTYRGKGEVWKIIELCKIVEVLNCSITIDSNGLHITRSEYYNRDISIINRNKIRKPQIKKIKEEVLFVGDYDTFEKWYENNCFKCLTKRNCPGMFAMNKAYKSGIIALYPASFIGYTDKKLNDICKHKDKQIHGLSIKEQEDLLLKYENNEKTV